MQEEIKEPELFQTTVKFDNSRTSIRVGNYPRINPGGTFSMSKDGEVKTYNVTTVSISLVNATQFLQLEDATSSFNPKVNDILDGFSKLFLEGFNILDKETRDLANTRYRHCMTCTMRNNNTCSTKKTGIDILSGEAKTGCGCNLAAKTKLRSSTCPLSKW